MANTKPTLYSINGLNPNPITEIGCQFNMRNLRVLFALHVFDNQTASLMCTVDTCSIFHVKLMFFTVYAITQYGIFRKKELSLTW
jgi:hypothetical protein